MIKQISLVFLATILLGAATLAAQHHPVFHIIKVSDTITLSQDLRVGAFILPAGTYRVDCDHTTLSFTSAANDKKVEMPCLGSDMNELAKNTELFIAVDSNGMDYLTKMYLKGSPVEHHFD